MRGEPHTALSCYFESDSNQVCAGSDKNLKNMFWKKENFLATIGSLLHTVKDVGVFFLSLVLDEVHYVLCYFDTAMSLLTVQASWFEIRKLDQSVFMVSIT